MSKKIDAVELERQINAKYGMHKNFELDENFHLIRELETDGIVVFRFDSPGDGHHQLKDASQEELEKVSDYFGMMSLVEEKDDASHIPGDDPIEDDGDSSDSGDGSADHIPD